MRTTIEITEAHHRALTAIAQRRGVRGFSPIVQEALDAYLQALDSDEIDLLLGLEGSLGDDDAAEVLARLREVRSTWRAS